MRARPEHSRQQDIESLVESKSRLTMLKLSRFPPSCLLGGAPRLPWGRSHSHIRLVWDRLGS